jgi:hypothetical protein
MPRPENKVLRYKKFLKLKRDFKVVNTSTPELNPSAQSCLPRIFTGNFNI